MNRLFSVVPICPLRCCFSRPAYYCWGSGGLANGVEYRNQFFTSAANPNIESTFVGVSNYVRILSDPASGTRCG